MAKYACVSELALFKYTACLILTRMLWKYFKGLQTFVAVCDFLLFCFLFLRSGNGMKTNLFYVYQEFSSIFVFIYLFFYKQCFSIIK